jgi:Kef-type K+ transport system membrane component KefB
MSEAIRGLNAGVWGLTFGPAIWALHFLVCYVGAAVFCAKRADPMSAWHLLQGGIAAATAVALAGIAFVGWRAYRHWGSWESAQPPHDADTAEDRRLFLSLSTLLLSGLSFVATVYTAMAALLAASCR